MNFLLTDVPKIYESLERVRDENGKHSQYATAIENLKHIFTVQASVTKTQQWIEEDKLLHAHQVMMSTFIWVLRTSTYIQVLFSVPFGFGKFSRRFVV